jgi:hypothetical protein
LTVTVTATATATATATEALEIGRLVLTVLAVDPAPTGADRGRSGADLGPIWGRSGESHW